MIESPVPRPTAGDWSDALLMSDTEALLGAVRNYIGLVKTPYDKRDLVAKLEAFLRRSETRESLLALLDPLDMKILGSALLLGPVSEQALKDLFIGEIPLFELGIRVANLLDRLLLFRYTVGGRRLLAINPLIEKELKTRVLSIENILGRSAKMAGSVPAAAETGNSVPGIAVDAKAAVALFSYLFHTPFSIRKGGGLTKRAADRFAGLYPEMAVGEEGDRPGVLARALSAAGALPVEDEEERYPDREAFARILAEWGEDMPYYLAACLANEGKGGRSSEGDRPPTGGYAGDGGGAVRGDRAPNGAPFGRSDSVRDLALVLAGALESLPGDLSLSRSSLARWLRIAARRARPASDPALALGALEELGILQTRGDLFFLATPPRPVSGSGGRGSVERGRGGVLVAEGSHALHLMPEASLDDRLFVGCVARPVSFGKVWSFEVERDTVRRAFAAGFSAREIRSRLESLSGMGLPQSFAFSLSAWEEEYRSLRLYRGFTLVADERQRPVIERSAALGRIVAETLAPGVYFLSAATAEEAIAALAAAGLDSPPVTQASVRRARERESPVAGEPKARGAEEPSVRGEIDALRDLFGSVASSVGALAAPDPEPRLAELRASLAASSRGEAERRELADRIERRIVLTERQIAQSDPHPERLEAGGLDYLGKVRVVERALRASGDRLEVLYRLPGEDPVRALLRPVKLDKNEKGLVLEAEDLVTGGPARVPLGAVSTVRRLRASLFGENQ
jgi:hypothetical protein